MGASREDIIRIFQYWRLANRQLDVEVLETGGCSQRSMGRLAHGRGRALRTAFAAHAGGRRAPPRTPLRATLCPAPRPPAVVDAGGRKAWVQMVQRVTGFNHYTSPPLLGFSLPMSALLYLEDGPGGTKLIAKQAREPPRCARACWR